MPSVSDSSAITESVTLWSFQRAITDNSVIRDVPNVKLDLGFLKLYFNNDNLNDIPDVYINAIELYDQAARNLQTYPLSRGDGLKLVNAQYGSKGIVIDGFIASATRALLETARDTLLGMIEPQEANLRFSQSGADRNYTATLANIAWNEKPGGGFATFSLQFACSDPFGYDTSASTDVNNAVITTQPSNQTFTAVGGSYMSFPTITATLGSGTGLTSTTMSFADHSGNVIYVQRTWTAGDILIINCATKAVTVNGASVDYSGVFPVFMPGDTIITYADTFTTRSVTLKVTHKNRWK